jgi:flagellar biosynthesis protein FlhB
MADNKTEKPTPRRRQKAREQGQVARTRDLPAVLATTVAFGIFAWQTPQAVQSWRGFLRMTLDASMNSSIQPTSPLFLWTGRELLRWSAPVMIGAFIIAFASSAAQGGLVFATEALVPNIERMNPGAKVKQVFSLSGLSALLKSLLPLSAILYLAGKAIFRSWSSLIAASTLDFTSFLRLTFNLAFEVTWKSLMVLLVWSAVDYLLVWRKHESDLRMTKEEMRQEFKETEGNPAVKSRIRQLQRRIRRQQMLRDTKTATVVITNPTHFAVAICYEPTMEAPRVVAKGRDLLAQQIKEVARWHGIPMVENPPLAQLMYRIVPVGHDIPAKLYTAVAEILAAVYRAQARVRQQARPARS